MLPRLPKNCSLPRSSKPSTERFAGITCALGTSAEQALGASISSATWDRIPLHRLRSASTKRANSTGSPLVVSEMPGVEQMRIHADYLLKPLLDPSGQGQLFLFEHYVESIEQIIEKGFAGYTLRRTEDRRAQSPPIAVLALVPKLFEPRVFHALGTAGFRRRDLITAQNMECWIFPAFPLQSGAIRQDLDYGHRQKHSVPRPQPCRRRAGHEAIHPAARRRVHGAGPAPRRGAHRL